MHWEQQENQDTLRSLGALRTEGAQGYTWSTRMHWEQRKHMDALGASVSL